MADITINHVLSGTVNITGDLTGSLVPSTKTPVLETLNVRIDPSQAQTLTPGTGVDGWNEVKVPQAMAIAINTDFVVAMGGNAYDTISAKNYIAVYNASGHNTTRFYKGTGQSPLNTADNDEIAIYAFYHMTGFSEIIMPSVAVIGSQAFGGSSVKTVRITKATGLVEFGENAFEGCSNLTDVYIHSSTKANANNSFVFKNVPHVNIHVPASLLSAYEADNNFNLQNSTIIGDL